MSIASPSTGDQQPTVANGRLPVAIDKSTHPLAQVLRKEWLDLRRDHRWLLLLGITLAMLAGALWLGLAHTHRLSHQLAHAEAGDRHVWTQQGSKNPHAAAHFGQYAHRPTTALMVADPGVTSFVGTVVWLEAHRRNDARFSSARDDAAGLRMGQLHLAFIWQTVLSLVALLLGHAAWATEREQGTLRQLLSLGVRPIHLMLGKALACMAVLGALLVLAGAGLGLGLWAGGAGLAPDRDDALRLGSLLLIYALYLGAFVLLPLAVSAFCRQPRTSLMVLVALWMAQVALAPRAVGEALRLADPLPTAQTFRAAIAADRSRAFGHDEQHPAFIAFRDRVLKTYGVQRLEDLPVNLRGLALRADDEAGYGVYEHHFGQLHAQLQRQDGWRATAGLAFPLLAVQSLSTALAGTDNRHHHEFLAQAEQHRRVIQTAISQDLIDNARPGDGG